MAGKHSRNFFEKKNENVVNSLVDGAHIKRRLSLPYKIIISVTALALCLSLVLVCSYFLPGKAHEKRMLEAARRFESGSSTQEGLQILESYNSDIKGWLKIEGAGINYAVCQTDNDSYYITHNQYGKKSRFGALFLSASDTFERDGDKNIVIYGNNMKDGSMFGSLKKYRNVNFYKQNPSFNLYYGNTEESYLIFAVMLISSAGDDDLSSYNPSKSYFIDQNEFDEWYTETKSRSLLSTNVDVKVDDEFLTLITVANDFEGARLVVLAKKSTPWQISQTDVMSSGVNPQIKYPKIWYTQRGLEYPY